MNHKIRNNIIYRVAEKAGLIHLCQAANPYRNYLYVLVYHRVDATEHRPWLDPTLINASPRQFAEQMHLVAQSYHPVSIEEVLEAADGGKPLPRHAVLVTVDDGYLDFAEVIHPILKSEGIRPVLFVPTGFVGEGHFWWDRLYQAIWFSRENRLSTPLGVVDLCSEAEKEHARAQLRMSLRELPFDEMLAAIDAITDAARPELPADGRSTLDWDELRRLARDGVTVAAHTCHHPLLSRLTLEKSRAEVRQSQQAIATQIGQALPVFALPDGKPETFTPEVLDILRTEGFKLVVTTVEGSGTLSEHRNLCFPRLGIWQRLSLPGFHFHLTHTYSYLKGYQA